MESMKRCPNCWLNVTMVSSEIISVKAKCPPTKVIMKKTFKITDSKLPVPRRVEAIKHEVKKYIQRERRKKLPDDVDFWDFDCRYGADEASSEVIHLSEINKHISQAEENGLETFYLEILVKSGIRTKKPRVIAETVTDESAADNAEEEV